MIDEQEKANIDSYYYKNKGGINMGESLWRMFLNEVIEDLPSVVLSVGIEGILSSFEFWLVDKGFVIYKPNNGKMGDA
jgi:hypothetical protein